MKNKINPIQDLCKKLKTDESYYISWQANIAMAFFDTYNQQHKGDHCNRKKLHKISNDAACYFLNLLMKQEGKKNV